MLLTLNEISKFSPPQTSIPVSYEPISSKYCLLIENKPPAITGVLKTKSLHLKTNPEIGIPLEVLIPVLYDFDLVFTTFDEVVSTI